MRAILAAICALAASGYCAEVCPDARMEKSGSSGDLSWSSGQGRVSADKTCTRHEVSSTPADRPLSVAWPAAGILEATIGGQFAAAFCCADEISIRQARLDYGSERRKSLNTFVHVGSSEADDDYPDLIEPDAKSERASFTGDLWDGSKFVKVDLELRASASYPHYRQSVFEFSITDRSPEPIQVDWDLLRDLKSNDMKSFFTDNPGNGYRQSTQVFFGSERPSPRTSVITIKTVAGKLLGRFEAEGFTTEAARKR